MRRVSTAAWIVAAGLGAAMLPPGGSIALAQPDPATGAGRATAEPEPRFDVDFPGGTFGEYFDLLARIASVNIVADDVARGLPMPVVRLRSVTASSAMQLVNHLRGSGPETMVQISTVGGSGSSIFVATATARAASIPPPMRPVNEVFAVGEVLRPAEEAPIEQQVRRIFELIESAMDLAPASSRPELAYHDQTQMLVFKGSPDQRALIASVLARYEQSWRPASARAEALRHELADVELQMLTSQIEAESTMRRVDVAERRHNELRELMNAGAVSGSEYLQSLVALDEARARVKILNAHAEHARRRHSDLARALAAVTQGQEPTPVIYDIRGLGQRGERTAAAFRDLVHAAQLPGTSLTVEGSGTLTLTARPPLHEALRSILDQFRADAAPAHDPAPAR